MNFDEIIHSFAAQLAEEEIQYSDLDTLLVQLAIPQEEIPKLKAKIDERSQEILMSQGTVKDKKHQFFQGVVLLIVGAILTLMNILEIGLLQDVKLFGISIGLMGFGGFLISKSKKEEPETDPPKRIKRLFDKD